MAWTYNAPVSGDTAYVTTLTNCVTELHTAVDGKSPTAGPGSAQAFTVGALSATTLVGGAAGAGSPDGISTHSAAGVSKRANIITSGTLASGAELAGYFGVNIFDATDTVQIGTVVGPSIKIATGTTGLVSMPSGGGLAVTGAISATTTIKTSGYTVSTLPAGVTGARAYVTDATAPTYNGALTSGGTVVVPVFFNGTAWVSS